MPQLDVLRAIAVALVIIHHWYYSFKIFSFLPNGELGVKLFFVLSGFLITRILLGYRKRVFIGESSFMQCLKTFYYRRFLRIFPIYYILLLVLLLTNHSEIRATIFWHFFYLSNYYFYFINHGWGGDVSHFWTLSVEEQFYIFWPFLILWVEEKYLLKVVVTTIICGVIFRTTNFSHSYMYNVLTPACFDSLGLGALLALKYDWIIVKIEKLRLIYTALLFLSFGLIIYFHRLNLVIFNQTFLGLFVSIFSFLVVSKISKGTKHLKSFFENKYLIYIGKISYGIYLFHNLIPFIYINHIPIFISYLLRLMILLLISSGSYLLIERPLLKFKN